MDLWYKCEVLLLLNGVGCCSLSVCYCKIFKFCFWMFSGDVVVSDGTGGLISMVWNSFFQGPETKYINRCYQGNRETSHSTTSHCHNHPSFNSKHDVIWGRSVFPMPGVRPYCMACCLHVWCYKCEWLQTHLLWTALHKLLPCLDTSTTP